MVVRLVPTTRRRCRPESGVDHVARTSNELDVEKVQPADITCGRKIGSAESSLAGPSSPGHVPDLLSRRCNFCVLNWVSWVVRWVDGVELARKKGRLLSILAAGSRAIGQDGRHARWEVSWAGNHSSRCHPGCSWRVGSSAVPLVRVCAAGVGSVWSWRTWRRAFTTGFTLDMLKNGRFLRKLGETRFSQCGLAVVWYRSGIVYHF